MTIYTNFQVSGVDYIDYKYLKVSKTNDESNSASSFSATLDSPYGRHKEDFTVGNQVEIYAGSPLTYTYNYVSGQSYSNLGSTLIGSQLVGSSLSAGTYDSGLSLYYRLEDGTGSIVTDYLSGANNGILAGSNLPTWNSNGKLGSCLSFASGLVMGGGSSWQILNNFSVCAWFKPSAVPSIDARIVGKTANHNGHLNYTIEYTAGSKLLGMSYLGDANGANCNDYKSLTSTNAVSIGSWHHAAYVFNSTLGSIYLYLDGSQACSPVSMGGTTNACTYWAAAGVAMSGTIGGTHSASKFYYTYSGLIDDVRIYRKVLSASEISTMYNSGAGIVYSSGAAVNVNHFYNDYSQNLSGTYITQTGSSIIGSRVFSGTTYIQDYTNIYTGSLTNIGSYSIGSQLINGSYYQNYDYLYNGSYTYITGSTISNKLFNGVLEKISFDGEGTTQTVDLEGRDYTLRLQDITVKPIVYTNTEISDIVKNIISVNEVPDITTNNVQTTTTTLKRISFNHTPLFDALSQLAKLSSTEGYQFYVDNDKDLHFEPKQSDNSGVVVNNSNILDMSFDESRQGMANKIWVYGDRYLSAVPTEKFTIGSPWGTGSYVLGLTYKPHNTEVSYLGSRLRGSVDGMTAYPSSGTDYGVSFDDKQIVLYSGTSFPKFPASGGSVIVNYQRDLPIAKYGQNDNSILMYGPKEEIIQDNSIKDPATATSILKQRLQNTDPLERIDCTIKGWENLSPGQTTNVVLDNFNLNDNYDIVQVDYRFDKETIQNEKIIRLNLNKKFIDITDKIKDLKNRLDKLESQNLQESDTITRLYQTTGSIVVTGSYWTVYSKGIGSSFILDHINNGLIGSYASHKLGGWYTSSSLLYSGT